MSGFNKEKDDEFDIEAAVSSLGEELFGASDEGNSDADTSDGSSADNSSVSPPDATNDGAGAAPVVADKTAEKESVDDAPQSPPPDSVAPPKTWRPEAAGMWAQLPPAVQQEVLKRESDIFQGIEQYRDLAQTGRTFQQTIAPFQDHFRAAGMDPVATVGNLLNAHHVLARGTPEQKLQLVRAIITDAGLSADDLLAEPPYLDPAVRDLRSELTSVKSQLQQREQRELETQRAALQVQVEKFFSAPANKYANEVATEMQNLIVSGQATDLASAYDKAIWLNPVVRGKVLAEQQAAARAAEEKANAEKAAAAKVAASANIRSTPKSGRTAATAPKSIDETLQETLAAIQSRS